MWGEGNFPGSLTLRRDIKFSRKKAGGIKKPPRYYPGGWTIRGCRWIRKPRNLFFTFYFLVLDSFFRSATSIAEIPSILSAGPEEPSLKFFFLASAYGKISRPPASFREGETGRSPLADLRGDQIAALRLYPASG
jgi:hypothetical protein